MGSVTFSDSFTQSYIGNGSYDVKIDFSENYNQSTNKTTVKITGISIRKNDNSANYGSMPVYGSIKVGGTTLVTMNGSPAYANMDGTSYRPVTGWSSSTVAVQHNDAGACTTTFKLTAGNTSNGCTLFGAFLLRAAFGVRTASKSVALTTHPRASSISSCSSSVETQGTFLLSVSRNSTAFYHKATITIGGTTMYTSDAFATSMSYTIPRTWFSSHSSVDSLTATVSVQTYSDSSCTTTVGSAVTQNFTITADAGMKPSVSAGWVSLAAYNTGAVAGFTGYVKNYSKAEATFDPTKIDMTDAVGASISSYSVTCQGETASVSPYRTPTLASTSVSVVCTVTDTRGRTASETIPLTVTDYASPVITGQTVFRCDSLGVADEDGQYFSVKATLTYSSVGGQNACSLKCAAAAAGGSFGSETTMTSGTASVIGNYSADQSYTVRIKAQDTIGNSTTWTVTIPTRKWAMKFRPTGNGVAFGKAPEADNVFEIASSWAVKSQGIVDLIYPVGSIYMSVNSTSPATLFGGTWARIEDTFLLAAGTTYTAGDTGGEAAHTLTTDEMPAHSHDIKLTSANLASGSNYARISSTGSWGSDLISSSGNGQAHNNMPPYLAVYVWKRTA